MGKKKSNASENIRVVVRVRDLKQDEIDEKHKVATKVDTASNQVMVYRPGLTEPNVWAFDQVFNNTFTQKAIFTQEVKPLVDFVLDGYNATVFAYGQSGSGKTYTMSGAIGADGDITKVDPAKYGMMPQAVEYLFDQVKKLTTTTKQFKVKVSYIELYNGKTRDLLSQHPDRSLDIREGPSGFYVKGAEIKEVKGFADCMNEFTVGTRHRQTAETNLNAQSSRSHALFSLIVEVFDYEHDAQAPVTSQSKMIIVDLAGSEKLGKTGAQGETMVEGCNINASLSALGTCIDKIVTSGPNAHIPYRANALTRLLKDSLGGNAKTVMFANAGPSDRNTDETISTLRFADNAKKIQNKPIKNIDPLKLQIMELQEQVADLKKRLGGDYDPDKEKNMQEEIDKLTLENNSLKQSIGRNEGGFEHEKEQLENQIAEAEAQLKKKESELVEACREKENIRTRLTNDLQHAANLRTIAMNFLRRVMTDDQLKIISQQIPQNVTRSTDDQDWTVGEISHYLDGFILMYEEWRKTSYNQEDLHKETSRVKAEVEGRLQNQLQVLEAERDQLMKQRDENRKDQETASEATSQLRVEMNQLRDESTKLREKIERDQEKFKKKMDKNKEETAALQQQVEAANAETEKAQREVDRLKRELAEGGGGGGSLNATINSHSGGLDGSGSPKSKDERVRKLQQDLEDALNAKKAADLRIRQMLVQTRRGAVVGLTGGIPGGPDGAGGVPPPPDGDEDENAVDAFAITETDKATIPDSDTLGLLQQQLRVQHRLQELNHNHQKKLDLLLRKYEMVRTGNVTKLDQRSGAGDSVSSEALQAKQIELDTLRSEMDKKLDKLTGKLNKTVTAYENQLRSLQEEKQALEEERNDANAHTEDLAKFNQQLAVEVETLRARLASQEKENASDAKLLQSENDTLKTMVGRLEQEIESNRMKVAELDELKHDYNKLQIIQERTEGQLREKLQALEANHQMIQWSNELVEQERRKTEEAELQIVNLQQDIQHMNEEFESRMLDHEAKWIAQKNEQLANQEAHFLDLIDDEKAKVQKAKQKLKNAKENEARAEKKYDEMVLENATLQMLFEQEKKTAQQAVLQMNQGGGGVRGVGNSAADIDSIRNSTQNLIRNQNRPRM